MEINARIIHRISDNCKRILADDALFIAILVVLVALSAFGLGRQSVSTTVAEKAPQSQILENKQTVKTNQVKAHALSSSTIRYVASKNSDKYHLPWCSGAKRITEENKIYFASQTEAKESGYTPAANCPALNN